MGWRERLLGWAARKREAGETLEATESDRGWRLVTGGSARDVPLAELHESLEQSDDAYRHNPLAFRIVELGVDFVMGRGMVLRCEDEAATRWLRAWWDHPLNNLGQRQLDLCRELALAGEVFVTLHTNPLDGMTYLRLLPASRIDQIETNPEDLEDELRYHELEDGRLNGRWWPSGSALARELGAAPAEATGALASAAEARSWPPEMRHYAANRLVGTLRGQGDLVALLPWLRRYRDWLTDRVRLNRYRQAFLFDVTLTGADRRAILARQADLAAAPEPGSIVVHNEKETWAAVRPEIGADESAADGLALRLMIAAGSGFPLHFLGEAAEANLATATAMAAPTLRRLERRQLYVGWLLTDLARACLRRSGRFPDADELALRAEFQPLSAEDVERVARAAASAAEALRTAQQMGWLGDAEARALFGRFVGESPSSRPS